MSPAPAPDRRARDTERCGGIRRGQMRDHLQAFNRKGCGRPSRLPCVLARSRQGLTRSTMRSGSGGESRASSHVSMHVRIVGLNRFAVRYFEGCV